jgi:hypothetical protein
MYDVSETVDKLIAANVFGVTTTAQAFTSIVGLKRGILFLNPTGSGQTVYFGACDLTTGIGFPVAAGQTIFIPCVISKNIFIIGSAGFNINYLAY